MNFIFYFILFGKPNILCIEVIMKSCLWFMDSISIVLWVLLTSASIAQEEEEKKKGTLYPFLLNSKYFSLKSKHFFTFSL